MRSLLTIFPLSENIANVRYLLPEKSEFEKLMQSWGVDQNDVIVIASLRKSYLS
jgi:3-mercaptopyruvate sulfurtransferase SseA